MKNIILSISILSVLGCGVTKEKKEVDKSVLTTETERKTVTREPSMVVNETKYNVKLKDTTITTTNYETKTILREIYDTKGNRTTECICDGIREDIETIKETLKKDISNEKTTEHNLDLAPLIWAIVGLGVVLIVLTIFLSKMQTKATQSLVTALTNK